jgi:hypothetical protein
VTVSPVFSIKILDLIEIQVLTRKLDEYKQKNER